MKKTDQKEIEEETSKQSPFSIGETQAVADLIKGFVAENLFKMEELQKEAEQLSGACDEIDRAWSGSFIGHHGAYYYGNLTPPPANNRWSIEWGTIHGIPDGWGAWEGEDIKKEVEKRAGEGFKIEAFSRKTERLAESAKKLKTDIEVELSGFQFGEGMEKEKELLSQIEKSEFDIHKARADYINSRVPRTRASRDSEAMMEGTYIPSHVTGRAGSYAADRIVESIKTFLELVDRFTRQLERKSGSSRKTVSPTFTSDPLIRLEKLLSRFHLVAQQLKERHSNRPTLEISDEYDTQDLLHALLKIEFDDIRAEEWTSQYAGSASRMDFLLKREEVVVEVKKTSSSLRDKQIGEQLILDIAHYKVHPNCKTLVCFIYDPDSIVKNREGLVNDLQKKHDELEVRVVFSP